MIIITREYLQNCSVDMIGYGAKDTGEMGGGAASSILQHAGNEIIPALKKELAKSTRQVSEVVITKAFSLNKKNIKWISHIISIIKNTSQGDYCPQPKNLALGVTKTLTFANILGAKSVAFSALATGEGRVNPTTSAKLMLDSAYDFIKENNLDIQIIFALPNYPEYQAFLARKNHLYRR